MARPSGKIVTSLVSDILMPPLGLLTGGVDFSNLKLVLKHGSTDPVTGKVIADTTLNYGMFINNTINFLIVAAAIFAVIKLMNSAKRKPVPVAVTPPPGPTKEEILLAEIRDAIRAKG